MDLRLAQLRTLREVIRRGSFSRASEALRLSQPAVSLHIRQLEAAFGAMLIERVGKRAFPTAAGELVLEHAERALAELETARGALAERQGKAKGRVRIGTGATASIYLLPPILQRLRRRHPDVELSVVTGNTTDVVKAVVDNTIDVAVVTLPVGGRELRVTPFYRDRLIAIASSEKAWRPRRALTPAELAKHPLILYEQRGAIRTVMESWFARAGAAPTIAMEVGNAEATKRLVGAGLGLSIISAIAVRRDVKAGEIVALDLSPPLARDLGLVRRRDKPVTPALQAVVEALEDFARRHGRGA